MPRSLKAFRDANALYSKMPCQVPGCTKNRQGVARYCTTHTRRYQEYGHPLASPLPRELYEEELREVSQLFKTYLDHPGLIAVLKWLDDWIDEASRGEAPAGNKMLGRIHVKRIHGRDGLSAIDLLTEVIAVWIFSRRHPQRLPDDLRLTVALSRNMARLATFEKRVSNGQKATHTPGSVELRETGERLRQVLASFVLNVEQSLARQKDKAEEFKASLSLPFVS